MLDVSKSTWDVWFKAWWAAHWTIEDLPGLRLLIRVYDRVARGDVRRLGELRQLMDSYGITPKGQQDRRWMRPIAQSATPVAKRAGPTIGERFRRRDPREMFWTRMSKELHDG